MNIIKFCYLLSLVALVKGNSVERCPACPSCDIGDRSDALQWSPVPNLASCMYGYDPFEMDRFTKGKPDPGVKKQIFEPTKYSTERNGMVPNDFLSWADDINCNVQESTTVVNTMTDFMNIMNGNNIFEDYESSSSSLNVPLWPFSLFVSYKKAKSTKNFHRQESDYDKQSKYFENTDGEVYINKAKCLVYRVSISADYAKGAFTASFIGALRRLQIAAKNPDKDYSKREKIKFIREFGTHYFDKCFLGASITTISRMSRNSSSLEEQNRRKNCVSNAYKEASSSGVKAPELDVTGSVESGSGGSLSASTTIGGWGYGSEEGFGSRSRKCDENDASFSQSNQNSLRQSEVIALGALPFNDRDTWVKETKVSPSPADFRLKSIGEILTSENLRNIPLDPNNEEGEKLDADLLKNFFQDTMEKYCDIMLGEPCPAVKGCHIWNDCNVGDICIDDNSEKGFVCIPVKSCRISNDCNHFEACVEDDNSEKGFFCTPASISWTFSMGEVAKQLSDVLGQYEYHGDKGYYVQTSTEQSNEEFEARYLYRDEDDKWWVSDTPGERSGWLRNTGSSQTPPINTHTWQYFDPTKKTWQENQDVFVTDDFSPMLSEFSVLLSVVAYPEKWKVLGKYLGSFIKTQRWWLGRPVYANEEGRLLYHGGDEYGWVIGDRIGTRVVLRGSDLRAYSTFGWEYYTGSEWKRAYDFDETIFPLD